MTLRSFKCVTLQGFYTLSYSLLSLVFATQWNPKHPSYLSTRLFCNSSVKTSISVETLSENAP